VSTHAPARLRDVQEPERDVRRIEEADVGHHGPPILGVHVDDGHTGALERLADDLGADRRPHHRRRQRPDEEHRPAQSSVRGLSVVAATRPHVQRPAEPPFEATCNRRLLETRPPG
jgi:hypothetical protein